MARKKIRLDELLLQRGLAPSRTKARALILAGKIRHGTEILDKAGKEFPPDIDLQVQQPPRYVSRGADKLAGWFSAFPWPVTGQRFLDVGASTGGFTDFLLQAGATEAVCVDVGRAQLHPKLVQDARVTNLERINARQLDPSQLPYPDYPLIVMDLSFISLRKVLPAVWPLLQHKGLLVALIKPQFEAGKELADKTRGVIRDSTQRQAIRDQVLHFALQNLTGARLHGLCESPIHGGDGNLEYLAGWTQIEGKIEGTGNLAVT